MQHAELLESFEPKIKAFAKAQGFIDKTKAQSDKFAAKVIEKLIKKHTDAAMAAVEDIMPLLMDVETAVSELQGQVDEIGSGRAANQFTLDVLKLELHIEQLTKKEFEQASKETAAAIEKVNEELKDVEAELVQFNELVNTWTELGTKAGILDSADDDGLIIE